MMQETFHYFLTKFPGFPAKRIPAHLLLPRGEAPGAVDPPQAPPRAGRRRGHPRGRSSGRRGSRPGANGAGRCDPGAGLGPPGGGTASVRGRLQPGRDRRRPGPFPWARSSPGSTTPWPRCVRIRVPGPTSNRIARDGASSNLRICDERSARVRTGENDGGEGRPRRATGRLVSITRINPSVLDRPRQQVLDIAETMHQTTHSRPVPAAPPPARAQRKSAFFILECSHQESAIGSPIP